MVKHRREIVLPDAGASYWKSLGQPSHRFRTAAEEWLRRDDDHKYCTEHHMSWVVEMS